MAPPHRADRALFLPFVVLNANEPIDNCPILGSHAVKGRGERVQGRGNKSKLRRATHFNSHIALSGFEIG